VRNGFWSILEEHSRSSPSGIGDGVDHIVPATDMMDSPGHGFTRSSIKMGDEEMFFPGPDGIGLGRNHLIKILLSCTISTGTSERVFRTVCEN